MTIATKNFPTLAGGLHFVEDLQATSLTLRVLNALTDAYWLTAIDGNWGEAVAKRYSGWMRENP